jgi:hypothetical protein
MRVPAPFWVSWLKIAAGAVMLFSAVLLLAPCVGQWMFNWVAFGAAVAPASVPDSAMPYIRFVYGVLGAVMIGWMLAILLLARGPFARGETWAWGAIAGSLGLWFIIDTSWSLLQGYPGNALLNLGFALLFAPPLAATRPGGGGA